MASEIARLAWHWKPQGPIVSGVAVPHQRAVASLRTRDEAHARRPAFASSSVKGVLREAAVWLVERVHRERSVNFITCDMLGALPDKSRPAGADIDQLMGLCPVCAVFGSAGCRGDEVSPVLRQRGRVRFSFGGANDVAHGVGRKSPAYRFMWQQIQNKGQALDVEQIVFDEETTLWAQFDPVDDYALSLMLLAGDLVSSGFFRFGRFTTRGYGHVRLTPSLLSRGRLVDMLSDDREVLDLSEIGVTGHGVAAAVLGTDPLDLIRARVLA